MLPVEVRAWMAFRRTNKMPDLKILIQADHTEVASAISGVIGTNIKHSYKNPKLTVGDGKGKPVVVKLRSNWSASHTGFEDASFNYSRSGVSFNSQHIPSLMKKAKADGIRYDRDVILNRILNDTARLRNKFSTEVHDAITKLNIRPGEFRLLNPEIAVRIPSMIDELSSVHSLLELHLFTFWPDLLSEFGPVEQITSDGTRIYGEDEENRRRLLGTRDTITAADLTKYLLATSRDRNEKEKTLPLLGGIPEEYRQGLEKRMSRKSGAYVDPMTRGTVLDLKVAKKTEVWWNAIEVERSRAATVMATFSVEDASVSED
jgi:hypothetical protein